MSRLLSVEVEYVLWLRVACSLQRAGVRLRRLNRARGGTSIRKPRQLSFLVLRYILAAIGKIGILGLILCAFALGLAGTVYRSLRSPNVEVPDVTNKAFGDGKTSLETAGLSIRERAKRFKSGVEPGMILDQFPRGGAIVKQGQTVAVIISRAAKEGESPTSDEIVEKEEEKKPSAGDSSNTNQNRERRRAPSNRNTNGNVNPNTNNQNKANANSQNGNAAANRTLNANAGRNGNSNDNRNRNANNRNANNRNANTTRNANRRPNQ